MVLELEFEECVDNVGEFITFFQNFPSVTGFDALNGKTLGLETCFSIGVCRLGCGGDEVMICFIERFELGVAILELTLSLCLEVNFLLTLPTRRHLLMAVLLVLLLSCFYYGQDSLCYCSVQ